MERCDAPPIVADLAYVNLSGLTYEQQRAAVIGAVTGKKPARHSVLRTAIGKLPATDPTLIGRDKELAILEAAWADPKTNFLQIIAPGGTGKTALMTKWYKRHLE